MRLLAALCVVLAGTTLYFWRVRPAPVLVPVPLPAAVSAANPETARATPERPRGRAMLGAVVRAMTAGGGEEEKPTPESRRERRQQWLRDTFGRAPGETDEAYRARVTPLVETMLWKPRQRVEERRAEFEEAADLSAEQKAELDKALADARAELVGMANAAVGAGDLTPYKRNTAGVLRAVGAGVGIVDGFDGRIRQMLSPEQAALLDQTGFDLIEYVGLTTPWETLTPPPPAPSL